MQGGKKMHSKVIIASLICMLAATFHCGNRTIPNFAQKDEPVAEETISRAPNDEQTDVWIPDETGNAGQPFDATISLEKERSNFGIIQKSSSLNVQCSFYGDYASVRITPPNLSGDYFVKFGYTYGSTPVVLSTIYVICINGHYSVSSLSVDDARASYFRNYVATSSELSYISNRDQFNYKSGNYTAYNTARFNAEKKYSEYISGGRDDVEFGATMTSRSGFGIATKLVLHASWIDTNGTSHPLAGVRADFMLKNTLLNSGSLNLTNSQGIYTANLYQFINSNENVSSIRCRLSSVCSATSVEDRFCQNYPICYSKSSSNLYKNYSQIDYYVYVYAGTSDRADAYELTQIQTIPFKYTNDYAETLDTIVTRFPAEHTDYHDVRHRDYFIDVQKEDAGSWDVLNHEYGHYICDKLGLARIEETRYAHDVHTPLEDDYFPLAYSEGLATYLGIAAQMYSSSAYNIPGYADEIYSDPYRNLSIDYNQFKPAVNGYLTRIYGERIESSVTSILLKMLDDVERTGDEIMLGHSGMWSILYNLSSDYDPCDSITKFIDEAIRQYCHDAFYNAIKTLKEKEDISDYVLPYSDSNKANWTIMIYACGADVCKYLFYDIKEMLSVPEQPKDVNIILEIGGFTDFVYPVGTDTYGIEPNYLNRCHVRNQQLVFDDKMKKADMNTQSTFEDFLDWGFRNYPAKNTAVILWNHGSGIVGCCGGLTGRMTHDAFENSFRKNGIRKKLEFIAYNACQMQIQDLADFNSDYFKYMIASEENMIASGFKYDCWIDDVYKNKDTISIYEQIVDTFIEYGDTLSVLKLSQMTSYKNAFEELARNIALKVQSNSAALRAFKSALLQTKKYADRRNGGIDGYDFLNKLQSSSYFSEQYSLIEIVKTKYKNSIAYEGHSAENDNSNGLAIVCGLNNNEYTINYRPQETNFTTWRNLVTSW